MEVRVPFVFWFSVDQVLTKVNMNNVYSPWLAAVDCLESSLDTQDCVFWVRAGRFGSDTNWQDFTWRLLQLDVKMPYTDPTSADAEWKKIQQNTFTRWCNEHLKCVNKYIYNLETDLCDGLKLIGLLQVLSHKKLPRHNKKPTFQSQKIENVSIALTFIEKENIRLVNIGELLAVL